MPKWKLKYPIFLIKTETTSMSKKKRKPVTLAAVDQMIQYSLELFFCNYLSIAVYS